MYRTNNENLQYRTGNAAPCPAVISMGRKFAREEIFAYI